MEFGREVGVSNLPKLSAKEDSICYSGLLKHEVEVLYTMNSMTWVR